MPTSPSTERKHTPQELASGRRYFLEFGSAMLAYAVVLLIGVSLLKPYPRLHVIAALAPMVPLVFALIAAMRFLRRMDEFGRQIQLEALGFGFVAGTMLTMTYGLLESIAQAPAIPMVWVPPVYLLAYGLGGFIAHRRYR